MLNNKSINNVRLRWLNDAEMYKQDFIIPLLPVIFMALLHRHSSKNHQRQRREKEWFKTRLSEEKDNITLLSGTSAGNPLSFPQVFFISLIQVYMSSKIKAILKGKKHLFMWKHSVNIILESLWHSFLHLFTVLKSTQYSCISSVNNVIRALVQGFKDKFGVYLFWFFYWIN